MFVGGSCFSVTTVSGHLSALIILSCKNNTSILAIIMVYSSGFIFTLHSGTNR